jgi:hypothetical protein
MRPNDKNQALYPGLNKGPSIPFLNFGKINPQLRYFTGEGHGKKKD